MAQVSQSLLLSQHTGILKKDACVVLVKTEWNHRFTDELERGCRSALAAAGVAHIHTLTVPGAVEIPHAIRQYWERARRKKRPHAFVALGCVIQGDTPHFDYVCRSVTDGITALNLQLPVPVIFGVLTVLNEQQALDRLGGPHGHKGEEAGITAVKMINLFK